MFGPIKTNKIVGHELLLAVSFMESLRRPNPMEVTKMTDSKKKWIKPELIVLVRNSPAEAVLLSCKGATGWQSQ